MSGTTTSGIGRRPLILAVLAACGTGAVALIAFETPALFGHRYPPTVYDYLLAKLRDRENANRLGSAALALDPEFNVAHISHDLDVRLADKSLTQALEDDFLGHRMAIINGWILPDTLVNLCALSASVSRLPSDAAGGNPAPKA